MPWMKHGSQMITRQTSNVLLFKEYEVVANEPLSSQVHLLVVRAKDFLQIVHPGKHVVAKLNDIGEYHFFFPPLFDNKTCSFLIHQFR